MVNSSIDQGAVEQYNANIRLAFQQLSARLRPYCYIESLTGQAHYFDRLGEATGAAESAPTANQTDGTPNEDPGHTKRYVAPTTNEWGTMRPHTESNRMLANPQSMYVTQGRATLNRLLDGKIITALGGNATDVTMNYGAAATLNAVGLPAGNKLDVGGATGMTLDKVLDAAEFLNANEVDDGQDVEGTAQGGQRVMVIAAKQLRELVDDPTLTSSDYTTVRALQSGKIDTFHGFKFVRTELLPHAANIRSCYAYHSSAMGLAVTEDIDVFVGEDPSQRFQTRVYLREQCGVTRIWDEAVVEIGCAETGP